MKNYYNNLKPEFSKYIVSQNLEIVEYKFEENKYVEYTTDTTLYSPEYTETKITTDNYIYYLSVRDFIEYLDCDEAYHNRPLIFTIHLRVKKVLRLVAKILLKDFKNCYI